MELDVDLHRIDSACRELGLPTETAKKLMEKVMSTKAFAGAGADVDVPAIDEPVTDREREMMQLLGTSSPTRLVHDLRNVLNELNLLKAAADF